MDNESPTYGWPGETVVIVRGKLANILRGRKKPKPQPKHEVVRAGSFGGVIPREFPTSAENIFTRLPVGNIPSSGISARIAARPNSAAMLESSDFYSQIPGVGRLLGVSSRPFSRQSPDVHPAAVNDVVHLRGRVHPTTSRKVLQGEKAL